MIKRAITFIGLASIAVGLQGLEANADQPQRVCAYDHVTVRSDFSAGRINACEEKPGGVVKLSITPEDEPPINPSPWYSFKVEPRGHEDIIVEISYTHAKHRYWPKVSRDGKEWFYLDKKAVHQLKDNVVRLSLGQQKSPLFVSAQEILTNEMHTKWSEDLAASSSLEMSNLGSSKAGRPIYKLEAPAGDGSRDYIMLIGRQHPPEVTGALALMAYSETIMADTELARRFRKNFGVIIIPALNPDGVEFGHWRHSLGDIDLNRDWTKFTQPETQLAKAELERFKAADRMWFFSDFHSTKRNVFYVQADSEMTNPPGFLRRWLGAAAKRDGVYDFEYAERPLTEQPTSKTYVYSTFGVPTVTYEVGDETDRGALDASAVIFAEEMMKALLFYKTKEQ